MSGPGSSHVVLVRQEEDATASLLTLYAALAHRGEPTGFGREDRVTNGAILMVFASLGLGQRNPGRAGGGVDVDREVGL